jgi:hypothetical protein
MDVSLTLDLPIPLVDELHEAAKECKLAPHLFVAEALESVLASQRLPRMRPGRNGPRVGMPGIEEIEEPVLAEEIATRETQI